jgi:hypothetical protein
MQGRRELGTTDVPVRYFEDNERLRTPQMARYRAPKNPETI